MILGEARELLLALVRYKMKANAKTYQTELAAFLDAVKPALTEIWKPDLASSASEGELEFGPDATIAEIVQGKKEAQGKEYRPPMEIMGKE